MSSIPFSSLSPYEKLLFIRTAIRNNKLVYNGKQVVFSQEFVSVIYSCPHCYNTQKYYVRPDDLLNLASNIRCIHCGNSSILKYVDEEPKIVLSEKVDKTLDYFFSL